MIPETQTQTREVISTLDASEELSFSVKSLANIFDLLHKSMYNDKPTAVAREIISNAIDANIESKTKNKVIIKLPSKLDPVFRVQDFGIGINKERLKCFSEYGNSTKVHTNKEIGGFGLGAKSPWSITDQFTITTITDGLKYKYLCYMDEKGIGKVKELFAIPTDEASGTTMEIPINKSDYTEKIREQAVLFMLCNPDKIKIVDSGLSFKSIYDTKQHTVPLKSFLPSNIHVYNWHEYGFNDCIIVLNGYVPYILDTKDSTDNLISSAYTFVAKIDIGVLDLPATREVLSNTPKNNRIFNKIREKIASGIMKLEEFLNERKKDNEQIGAITLKYSPVRLEICQFNTEYIHSSYSKPQIGDTFKQRHVYNVHSPSNKIPRFIMVKITELKNPKITYLEYADHILKKFPHYKSVHFIKPYHDDADDTKNFQIVPIHCFAPPLKQKQKVIKTPVDKEEINKDKETRRFCGYDKDGVYEKAFIYKDIKEHPEDYRKVETMYSNIEDSTIKQHIFYLKKKECQCNYKIVLVNKTDARMFKKVELLKPEDFVICKHLYKDLTLVHMLRYGANKILKNKQYTGRLIPDLCEFLNSKLEITFDPYLYGVNYHKDIHVVKINKFRMAERISRYKMDDQLFKSYKTEAYKRMDDFVRVVNNDPMMAMVINNNHRVNSDIYEDYVSRTKLIFGDIKELFK
ncbi:MAG: hypothetical protein CVT92_02600 [Bacteroidetes bacterium HGW-Bacteroidetes-1]|jgi:hypothetical protein|nr:MAG: hypothetical protein CVT92_02600 [Bacteroidetes bacterium HGW-Bacteroidetes-1]